MYDKLEFTMTDTLIYNDEPKRHDYHIIVTVLL